jgi:hypothetical protein
MEMKRLRIALVLALPVIAACSQSANQPSLSPGFSPGAGAAQRISGAHPAATCAYLSQGTSSSGGFLKWKVCGGIKGRITYGPGSVGNLKISTQSSLSNPGGVPVPSGETPVLFVQQQVLPGDPAPANFTAPTVPPLGSRSKIYGVPSGTYQLFAYIGATLQSGFPINLGSPTAGVLKFTASPWSPLPPLGTIPVGTTVSFELVTP